MLILFSIVVLQLFGGTLFGLGLLGGQQVHSIEAKTWKMVYWRVAPYLDSSSVGWLEILFVSSSKFVIVIAPLGVLLILYLFIEERVLALIALGISAAMIIAMVRSAAQDVKYHGWKKSVDDWIQMVVLSGFPLWPLVIALPSTLVILLKASMLNAIGSTLLIAASFVAASSLVLVVPFCMGKYSRVTLMILGAALYAFGSWLPLNR